MHTAGILALAADSSVLKSLKGQKVINIAPVTAATDGTVVVTTHFMEEAEYCDHVAIMDAGRVLAQGTPAEIRLHGRVDGREPTMEDAFIAIVEEARESAALANGGAAA